MFGDGACQLLDRAARGRDEDDLSWTMAWVCRHDEHAGSRS